MIGLDGVSAQALSDTIGAVYDCALDRQLRLATCRRIARLRESACCTTRRRRSLRWLIKSCCVLLRIRVGRLETPALVRLLHRASRYGFDPAAAACRRGQCLRWNGIRVGVITPRVREYRNDVDLRMVGDNVLRRSTTGRGRSKRQ